MIFQGMLRCRCAVDLGVRSFSSTAHVAAKAGAAKGKKPPPPKKKTSSSFAKKGKPGKDGSGGGAGLSGSGAKPMSARLAATRDAAVQLNKTAPRLKLDPLSPSSFDSGSQASIFEIPEAVYAQLLKLGLPQSGQGHNSFAQLATVMRAGSTEVGKIVGKAGGSGGRRVVVDGPGGSGKSTILLQAAARALMDKWVVVAFSRGEELVDSSHGYAYDERLKGWRQDTYASALCARTAEANKTLLQQHDCSTQHVFDRHTLPAPSSLYKLLQVGAADAAVAQAVFDQFIEELNADGRPQTLLLFDNLSVASVPTRYRAPDFSHIHPLDLHLVKFVYDHVNGTRELANGAVVACTSSVPGVRARSLDLGLHADKKRAAPFEYVDDRIIDAVKGVPVIDVGAYTPAEASAIIGHYANAGLIRSPINASAQTPSDPPSTTSSTAAIAPQNMDANIIHSKLLVAGHIPREVFRACTRLT
ncbi:hypothetical protein PYCC9005_004897 [Savitreella phatthalungensis]